MRLRPTEMELKRLARGAAVLLAVALLPVRVEPQQDWFRTGTCLGVEKLRVALPSFAAFATEAETLAGIFNATLWNDLAMSGVVELVSSSFYPLEGPTRPGDLNHEAWVASPTEAHMVAYGNLEFLNADLAVNAWLSDVRNPGAPESESSCPVAQHLVQMGKGLRA